MVISMSSDLPFSQVHPSLSEPEQREITRLCVETGLLLLQYGAESALVESVTRRLGLALGIERVEVAIMANAITLTSLSAKHCITTVRRNEERGINMHVVTETQRAVLAVEAGELDRAGFRQRVDSIKPLRYPRWLVALMIGLSCACFARLAGADLPGCALTFVASMLAMLVRQWFAALHFNPLVTFFAAAFVATSVAGQGLAYKIGEFPKLAMASCVLLLVPGFPMINSIADMVKGYINTGLARGMMAVLLGGATSAGIMLAMTVWHFPGTELATNPAVSGHTLVQLFQTMALAAVPAVGFALVFNVPTHALGYCAAGGAIGRGLRYLLAPTVMPIELATFVAAAVVSLLGVYIARRMRAHPKVFTVAAMIPMIPGVHFFTALTAVLEIQRNGFTPELLSTAVTSGLSAAFIVAALAIGLAVPGLLFYRRKPVV
jgi:uncharacterized membrane protein YjjP (DUF1212 family)